MVASASSLGLRQNQLNWALRVVARIKARAGGLGLKADEPQRVADIALGTCLTESGLQMYANGNNAASLRLPHDAVGWDHGSVGLFQQQVGGAANSTANWGTTAQCMDVNYSTDTFVNALMRKGWRGMTNWNAAQAVQGSFDPTGGNYKRNDARAIQIRKAIWDQAGSVHIPTPTVPTKPIVSKPTPKPPAGHTYKVVSGDNLTVIAARYHTTVANLVAWNHIANPNLIKIGQVLNVGGAAPAPKPAATKSYTVKSGDNLSAIASANHTSVSQLVSWNRGKYPGLGSNPNLIQPGWVLRVG